MILTHLGNHVKFQQYLSVQVHICPNYEPNLVTYMFFYLQSFKGRGFTNLDIGRKF